MLCDYDCDGPLYTRQKFLFADLLAICGIEWQTLVHYSNELILQVLENKRQSTKTAFNSVLA